MEYKACRFTVRPPKDGIVRLEMSEDLLGKGTVLFTDYEQEEAIRTLEAFSNYIKEQIKAAKVKDAASVHGT